MSEPIPDTPIDDAMVLSEHPDVGVEVEHDDAITDGDPLEGDDLPDIAPDESEPPA